MVLKRSCIFYWQKNPSCDSVYFSKLINPEKTLFRGRGGVLKKCIEVFTNKNNIIIVLVIQNNAWRFLQLIIGDFVDTSSYAT